MKSIKALNTVAEGKQIKIGAIFFLLANNVTFNQFIQLWRCLTLKINPRLK